MSLGKKIVGLIMVLVLTMALSACIGSSPGIRLQIDITGQGSVVRDPELTYYEKNTEVSLTAIPAQGWEFSRWEGETEGVDLTTTVVMTKTLTVIAVFLPIDTDAVVTGIVTDGRGGPAVEGATVTYDGYYVTTTDENGAFALPIPAGVTADLLVRRPDGGATRVQDITASIDETVHFEIPTRPVFHPDWSNEPPRIEVDLERDQELSGIVELTVTAISEHDIYLMYAYFGGEQRFPNNGFVVDSEEMTLSLNTALYPDGFGYLRLLAYDMNEMAVLMRIPVFINNASAEEEELPGEIGQLQIRAETYGENIRFYSSPNPTILQTLGWEGEIEPLSAPPDGMIRNLLSWTSAPNATGYKVYRSFDGTNFRHIGNIAGSTRYDDYSPELAVGKQTWYNIVPYNGAGEGDEASCNVTPLPSYHIDLVSPANNEMNVDLFPTFEWAYNPLTPFPMDVEFETTLRVYNATGSLIHDSRVNNETEYELTTNILAPGGVYTWDIYDSSALVIERYDSSGYSIAISYPTWPLSGSYQGENIFTTTTVINSEEDQ